MAASTKPTDGSFFRFQYSTDGGTTYDELGYQKESGLQIATEFREITSKAQCDYREKVATVSTWTVSGTAEYYTSGATLSVFSDLLALRGTEINIKITAVDCEGAPIVGEKEFYGRGFWSQLDVSFPEKETASFSYTFEGSGTLTEDTIV
jgi:hypothetical protein